MARPIKATPVSIQEEFEELLEQLEPSQDKKLKDSVEELRKKRTKNDTRRD